MKSVKLLELFPVLCFLFTIYRLMKPQLVYYLNMLKNNFPQSSTLVIIAPNY